MCLSNKKIPDLPEIPEKERTPLVNEMMTNPPGNITGKLPEHIKGHYNINLVRYILPENGNNQ
jgi:hypothetical protein